MQSPPRAYTADDASNDHANDDASTGTGVFRLRDDPAALTDDPIFALDQIARRLLSHSRNLSALEA